MTHTVEAVVENALKES